MIINFLIIIQENNMWKAIAITGGIVAVVCSFALWCAAKVGSDDDDFWGIGDERTEEVVLRESAHEKR